MKITPKRVLVGIVGLVGVGVVGSVVASPDTYPEPAAPAVAATSKPATKPAVKPATPRPAGVVVTRVVDADTFDVGTTRYRIIGVDAPEADTTAGDAATAWATTVLDGETVRLEPDPSQPEKDRYGRSLVHVFLPDGSNYGQVLIGQGHAVEYTVGKAHRFQGLYRNTQRAAQKGSDPAVEAEGDVYYGSCSEAREAGAAPLREGDPGYRRGLDRDGDGEACES